MKWYVCDMDEGVLAIETNRKAAVDWLIRNTDADRVLGRYSYGPGYYEYSVGGADREVSQQACIVREDRLQDYGLTAD